MRRPARPLGEAAVCGGPRRGPLPACRAPLAGGGWRWLPAAALVLGVAHAERAPAVSPLAKGSGDSSASPLAISVDGRGLLKRSSPAQAHFWPSAPRGSAELELQTVALQSGWQHLDLAGAPDATPQSISSKSYDDRERLVGVSMAAVMLAAVPILAGILYMVNYPDPQIQSYSIKLVSACTSIYCAVLLERVQVGFLKTQVLMPVLRTLLGLHYGDYKEICMEYGLSFLLFLVWFFAISDLSARFRTSPPDLFAIKSFVAHEAAFVAIHTFGYWQKLTAYQFFAKDTAKVTAWYVSMPFLFCLLVTLFQGPAALYRRRLLGAAASAPAIQEGKADAGQEGVVHKPSTAGSEVSGASAGGASRKGTKDTEAMTSTGTMMERGASKGRPLGGKPGHLVHWEESCVEGENDANAVAMSFLLRQALLYLVTGRMPSLKGDAETHSTEEFTWLLVGNIGLVVILLAISYGKKLCFSLSADGNDEEGFLLQKTNFTQMLLCMTVGWCSLLMAQWIVQTQITHFACWNIGAAVIISPWSLLILIVVDKLADRGLMPSSLEPAIVESSGLLIGFAWEMAFASAIDTVSKEAPVHKFLTQFVLCLVLVAILVPAWRIYMVPRAHLPTPERT